MNDGGIGRAVIVGLLGAGIARSRSPRMHEAEGARQGLRYVYRLLDSDAPGFPGGDIGALLRTARFLGFRGLNVTYPYKQAVVPFLDALSGEAAQLGAVNTIVFDADGMTGHNTDLHGFAIAFDSAMRDAPRRHVVQVGAGGAGSAVARALLAAGVRHLTIVDLDSERADRLATQLAADFGRERVAACPLAVVQPEDVDGLVNTTPVGMAKSPGMPVPATFLRPQMWVADIVYVPLETELLQTARALGCRTLSGRAMAVHQAARSFQLFTGLEPNVSAMERTFDGFDQQTAPEADHQPAASPDLSPRLRAG